MYTRILVPLDGSETAQQGLRHAIGLAASQPPAQRARLLLLSVIDDFASLMELSATQSYQAMREDLLRQADGVLSRAHAAAAEAGVESDTALREVTNQRVADVILDEARRDGCDLIVIGTHGRRALSRVVLGSVADGVLRSSPVLVLLIRHPESR